MQAQYFQQPQEQRQHQRESDAESENNNGTLEGNSDEEDEVPEDESQWLSLPDSHAPLGSIANSKHPFEKVEVEE